MTAPVTPVDERDFEARVRSFELNDPSLQEDPNPFFAELRGRCPVAHSEAAGGFYAVSKYEDVLFIYQHPEIFSASENTVPPVVHPEGPSIPTQLDPPEHTRYRRVLQPAFTPQVVATIEPAAREITRRLLEPLVAAGSCELVSDFSLRLPAEVFLTHILGLPFADLERFLGWKDTILRNISTTDPATYQATVVTARAELFSYLGEVFEARRSIGGGEDDLIGRLVRVRFEDGTQMSANEFSSHGLPRLPCRPRHRRLPARFCHRVQRSSSGAP